MVFIVVRVPDAVLFDLILSRPKRVDVHFLDDFYAPSAPASLLLLETLTLLVCESTQGYLHALLNEDAGLRPEVHLKA